MDRSLIEYQDTLNELILLLNRQRQIAKSENPYSYLHLSHNLGSALDVNETIAPGKPTQPTHICKTGVSLIMFIISLESCADKRAIDEKKYYGYQVQIQAMI